MPSTTTARTTNVSYDYQQFGAGWLAAKNAAILADEPGLGKTITAICAMELVGASRVLVICPAVAKQNWKKELGRWMTRNRYVQVLSGYSDKIREAHPGDGSVIIVNYDLLSNRQSRPLRQLLRRSFDLVIIDEAHALKNKSNRTKAIYGRNIDCKGGILERASQTWLLTGTPMPNHCGELWTHLHALEPGRIMHMTKQSFEDKYCVVRDTVFGRQITGSRNIPELKKRMENFVLRRTAKQVLPELPDLLIDYVPLDVGQALSPRSVFGTFEKVAGLTDVKDNPDELLRVLTKQGTAIATERRNTGMAKLPYCLDWLENEMATTSSKFIVFAHHHDVIDGIMEKAQNMGLFHTVKIDGRDSELKRELAVEQFQDDPQTRLFVGQLGAAGEAITLTAANRVVFFEPDWTPKNVYQGIRRALRIGQKNHVLAQFLTLPKTIDERINKAVMAKAADIHEMFG